MTLDRRRMIAASLGFAAGVSVLPARGQDLGLLLEDLDIELYAAPTALPTDIARASGHTHTQGFDARPYVAMTFDDGPHPSLTPRLLDMFKARNARATFYVIGALVNRYPDIVRRIVDEGHELGNHTYRHPFLSSHGDRRVLEELDRTSDAINRAIGHVPLTMRPPYGAITARQRGMIYNRLDLQTVLWSVDTSDWKRPGSSVVARRVINGARGGAIILAHDIHPPTVNAMPRALDGVIDRGFQFITVSEILGLAPPTPSSPFDHIALM